MKHVLQRATMITIIAVSSQNFYAMEDSKNSLENHLGSHEYSRSINNIIIYLQNKNQEIQNIKPQSDDREKKRKIKEIQNRQTQYLQVARLKLYEALNAALDCSNDNRAALEEIAALQNKDK